MEYQEFYERVSYCQTTKVKALNFPGSCAPKNIPVSFLLLVPQLVAIIDSWNQHLCNDQQLIGLVGLQLCSPTLESNTPLLKNRIFNPGSPHEHCCCTLDYLLIDNNVSGNINSHVGARTIIIDFTSGLIMDSLAYARRVLNSEQKGTTYGYFDEHLLQQAWYQFYSAKKKDYGMAKKSILVVEDNDFVRLAHQTLLSPYYEVTALETGEEALRQPLESYSAVLLDIDLPGVSGIEVARQIRQKETGKDLPILGITAHQLDSDKVRQAEQSGMNDILSKPVQPEKLHQIIEQHLGELA